MKLTYAQKFIGGMIGILGVTIVVNATLVVLAAKSNDGLVTENYYKNGLRYGEERARELNLPGWNVTLQAPHVAQKDVPIVLMVAGKDHLPLTGATVRLKLYRPTHAGYDQVVPMHETSEGRFEATVNLPLKGLWDATFAIQKGTDRYDYRQRLHLETTGA